MDKKSSPAYTMSSRLKQTLNKISPGPMSYRQNMQIVKPSGPKAVIGKAPRLVFKQNDSPAPGQYDVEKLKIVRPKSSSAVFPTSRQTPVKEIQRKLGPGCYQPDYEKVFRKSLSSSKFSRTQKFFLKDQTTNIVPGPMSYSPKLEFVLNSSPGTKFGHSQRIDQTKLKALFPGPGKYVSQKVNIHPSQPAYKFPNQKRETIKIQKGLPGRKNLINKALDYKIEGQFQENIKHGKGFKISTNIKLNSGKVDTPGPNAQQKFCYVSHSEKKICLKRAPAFSISHSDRKSKLGSEAHTPGPNKYNPSLEPKKRVGSALITTSRRETQIQLQRKKTIPGPGAYQKAYQYKTIGTGVKFTIPRSKIEKQKEIKSQRRPGPWSYNTIDSLKQTLKFGVMGKSQRISSQKKGIPGPGQYVIKDQRKPGVVIGKQKRSKQKTQNIPGPNSYIIPSTIGSLPYYEKSFQK